MSMPSTSAPPPCPARPARARRLRGLLGGALMLLALAGCATTAPLPAAERHPAALDASTFVASDGIRLPVRRWPAAQPARAVVLALHGVNDYSLAFDETARYFAAAGVGTVAYDQRGFGYAPDRGRWPGTAALVSDLREVLALLKREHPELPLYVLGESMGGAVAALALQPPPPEVDGVVLVTPAVWSRHAMPWYQRFGIWIGALLTPAMTLSGEAFNFAPSDNPEVARRRQHDPGLINGTRMDNLSGLTDLMDGAAPVIPGLKPRSLLLYGLRDQMMPRRPMIALHQRWPAGAAANFRFALYPQGHHTLLRDLQRQVVWDDVLSWLLQPARPLPSGFERRQGELLPLLRADD